MHSNAVVINDVCSSFVQRTDGRIGRIYMAEANTAPVDTSAVAKAVELAQQLRPMTRPVESWAWCPTEQTKKRETP